MNYARLMRRVASGQFELHLPAREAIGLFTPEGERGWAPGWDPNYPAGEVATTAGTVFTTDAHGMETIWLIQNVDTAECKVAYSRVTPGHHAGTVRVDCKDASHGGCVVSVSYDMSSLPGSDPTGLDAYDEASFAAMLNHWSHAINHSLG